jgi:hypothetical protein
MGFLFMIREKIKASFDSIRFHSRELNPRSGTNGDDSIAPLLETQ